MKRGGQKQRAAQKRASTAAFFQSAPLQKRYDDDEIYTLINKFLYTECVENKRNVTTTKCIQEYLEREFNDSIYNIVDMKSRNCPVNEYESTFTKVRFFITLYMKQNAIGSVFDLSRALLLLLEEKKIAELWQIGVGNLLTHPGFTAVANNLLLPSVTEIPPITVGEVVSCIFDFDRNKKKGRNQKMDVVAFLKSFAEKKGYPSYQHTGVFVNSPGLCFAMKKRLTNAARTEIEGTLKLLYNNEESEERQALKKQVQLSLEKKATKTITKQVQKQIDETLKSLVFCFCQAHTKKKKKLLREALLDEFAKPKTSLSLRELAELEKKILLKLNDAQAKSITDVTEHYCSLISSMFSMEDELHLNDLYFGSANPTALSATPNGASSVKVGIMECEQLTELIQNLLLDKLFRHPVERNQLSDILAFLEEFSIQLCHKHSCEQFSDLTIDPAGSILQYVIKRKEIYWILDWFVNESVPVIDAILKVSPTHASNTDQIQNVLQMVPSSCPSQLLQFTVLELLLEKARARNAVLARDYSKIRPVEYLVTNLVSARAFIEDVGDDQEVMKLIQKASYYYNLDDTLGWTERYQQKFGSLSDFIERHHTSFIDQFCDFGGNYIIRLPRNINLSIAQCVTLPAYEFAMHIVGYVFSQGSIENVPVPASQSHLKEILGSKYPDAISNAAESRVKFCVEVAHHIPSVVLCSAILQKIIFPALAMDKLTMYPLFLSFWPLSSRARLRRIGDHLGISEFQAEFTPFNFQPNESQSNEEKSREEEKVISESIDNDTEKGNSVGYGLFIGDFAEVQALDELLARPQAKDIDDDVIIEYQPELVDNDKKDEAESTPVDEHTPEEKAQKVIADILEQEFGVGIDQEAWSDKTLAFTRNLMNQLESATIRLAGELYSKDFHFLLELIQNADDNAYTNATPTLRFAVSEHGIITGNNENGFSNANIQALCRVGRSTKANLSGYIGNKGIGFKSVFRVTDSPQIHSNGFHISFDRKQHGDIGLIKPTWIDSSEPLTHLSPNNDELIPSEEETKLLHDLQKNFTTVIALPFNIKGKKERLSAETVRKNFEQMDSLLLLFLHKIKRIELHVLANNTLRVMTRTDYQSSDIIMLEESQCEATPTENGSATVWSKKTSTWLLVRKELQIPPRLQQFAKNDEDTATQQQRTSIVIALPLEKDQNSWQLAINRTEYPLFAYLPLIYSEGLKFVVQADFKVPSSRETVDSDSEWNQWLRSELPGVFRQGVENVLQRSGTIQQKIRTTKAFLHYLPTTCRQFFKSLPVDLGRELHTIPCLLDVDGISCAPANLLTVDDPEWCTLLSNDTLRQHIDKSWLHPEISRDIASKAKLLEILPFTLDVLLQLLDSCVRKQTLTSNLDDIKWLASILLHAFKALQDKTITAQAKKDFEFYNALSALPIFPTHCNHRNILQSLKNRNDRVLLFSSNIKDPSKIIIPPNVSVLRTEFYSHFEQEKQAQFLTLLEKLGVVVIRSDVDLLQEIIIPYFQHIRADHKKTIEARKNNADSNNNESSAENEFIITGTPETLKAVKGYFNMILQTPVLLEELDTKQQLFDRLAQVIVVPTNQGQIVCPESAEVHTPMTEHEFAWPVIISLPNKVKLTNLQKIILAKLDIIDGPHVLAVTLPSLTNYISPEFLSLVNNCSKPKMSKIILNFLNKPENLKYYLQYFTQKVNGESNGQPSTLATTLTDNNWIYCARSEKFLKPPQCFIYQLQEKSLLKDFETFLPIELQPALEKVLGVQTEFNVLQYLNFLGRFSPEKMQGNIEDIERVVIPKKTAITIFEVYQKLNDFNPELLINEFKNRRLLFLPDDDTQKDALQWRGRFIVSTICAVGYDRRFSDDVYAYPTYKNTFALFDLDLSKNVKHFFTRIRMKRFPDLRELIQSMQTFVQKYPEKAAENIDKIKQNLETILRDFRDAPPGQPGDDLFNYVSLIPLWGNKWTSVINIQKSKVFIADDSVNKEILTTFGEKGESILRFTFKELIDRIGGNSCIPLHVQRSVCPEVPQLVTNDSEVKNEVAQLLPFIQRYLYHFHGKYTITWHRLLYDGELLQSMACYQAESIILRYTMRDSKVNAAFEEQIDCECERFIASASKGEQVNMYLKESFTTNQMLEALSRLLFGHVENDFVIKLLNLKDANRSLLPLPSDVEPWVFKGVQIIQESEDEPEDELESSSKMTEQEIMSYRPAKRKIIPKKQDNFDEPPTELFGPAAISYERAIALADGDDYQPSEPSTPGNVFIANSSDPTFLAKNNISSNHSNAAANGNSEEEEESREFNGTNLNKTGTSENNIDENQKNSTIQEREDYEVDKSGNENAEPAMANHSHKKIHEKDDFEDDFEDESKERVPFDVRNYNDKSKNVYPLNTSKLKPVVKRNNRTTPKGALTFSKNVANILKALNDDTKRIQEFDVKDLVISTHSNVLGGQLGEYLAFEYLKEQYPNNTVTWANEKEESFLPYDIVLHTETQTVLVEVKSTTYPRDPNFHIPFYMSYRELSQAQEVSDKSLPIQYWIFFIYCVDSTPQFVIFDDLIDDLQNNHKKLLILS